MSGNSITITCPKCQAVNQRRGKAMTVAMSCTSCNAYFRMGSWNRKIVKFHDATAIAIPLGAKGKIDGTIYEVMGFVVKREKKYRYQWREYFLFNPFKGYAFLSEYNGHWNFLWPIEDRPAAGTDTKFFEGVTFHLYQKFSAEVLLARGEFFMDVIDVTDSTRNSEFIAPPYMYVREGSADSVLWCKGKYITPGEVKGAFKIDDKHMPKKTGLGYTEPIIGNFHPNSLILISILVGFLMILLQFIFNNTSLDAEVFRETYYQAGLSNQKIIVTPSFTLEGGSRSLVVEVNSPVDNDWFFAELSLINEETGTEYNFTQEIEYYYGYDDGAWSEGSRKGEAFLSEIRGGKYHINIYPEFSTSKKNHDFTIVVKRDVPNISNFVVAAVLIALFPVGYFIRRRMLEHRRWADSEYTPFEH